jgi:predicted RNA-binding Zn-ribbon protein involved in translation (DUF1610 family)
MSDVLAKCSVCEALLDEEDLFCSNCGTEAPKRDNKSQLAARSFTHKFACSGCGASMSYDASAGSLRCPFCGSADLVQNPDAKEIAPRRVVPFELKQDQAIATMRTWLGRGFWRPGDLSQQAAVVAMTAVYVPYWIFRADTHTFWTADTSQTPAGARADWYPLSGQHRGRYEGLLIGASGALTAGETHSLCPFDLAQGVEPDQVDLDNVVVEQFGLARKYARPLARQGLEELERQACQVNYVPGRARNVKVNVRIEGLASEPVLLPVWIMAYRYADQVFRFLVNGQTGRATGRAPISWRKILTAAGIALAVIAVIVAIAALTQVR